ncbi:dipeptidase [Paracoccus sp. 1_MG-2023]|uniref:dipeptidase n=1 Tax=unclassified Paracoccus (in: a-proteobacteria) TaxID=2688777 RepID=UPI001C0A2936|nr:MULTISPECIES: dipeptidase [unclassified Paracoccus (in: a-proteobacteria)]MBU2956670.1 dipeptidase [Paracoccus sp. C2R09]MDO6668775.1 dipeptidase [Paracoccus sp. 1_MG-2023]
MIPVFDGHNDLLQRIVAAGPGGQDLWLKGNGQGHMDLPRIRKGGMVGGFFAIWVPSPAGFDDEDALRQLENPPFRLPLPDPIPPAQAIPHAMQQAAALLSLERTGTLRVVRGITDLHEAMAQGQVAAIMHMEGIEAIPDMDALHLWHRLGLRSLGPVWSRNTRYADGVPFAYPATPDIGAGLSPEGKRLVAECNALRIMLDLSHLNEAGFNDIARLSDAPLVASHSCAHAICPSSRNLTDRQLQVIAESRGLVGLNYASSFLREDGRRLPLENLDVMLRHMDHMLAILGEDGVALGSDFDGALMPADLADVAAVPNLIAAMERAGYGEALIRKITSENWISVLERTWKDG